AGGDGVGRADPRTVSVRVYEAAIGAASPLDRPPRPARRACWHPMTHVPDDTEVYTDGSCLRNPGPGGWAWAVRTGPYASGSESSSTNQRMEITAVLRALESLEGPLVVKSDSTYVVNCFRDRWGPVGGEEYPHLCRNFLRCRGGGGWPPPGGAQQPGKAGGQPRSLGAP